MGREPGQEFEDRQDILVDLDGTAYCWICYREILGEPAFVVTGQRLGNERCSSCGHPGSTVLEATSENQVAS